LAKSKKTLDDILNKYKVEKGNGGQNSPFLSSNKTTKINNKPVSTKSDNKTASIKPKKREQSKSSAPSLDDILNKYEAKPKYTFSGKTSSKHSGYNSETKNAYTSAKDKVTSKTTIKSNLSDDERKARIKTINSELNTLKTKLSGYSRASAYGTSKAMKEAKKRDSDRIAELTQELKELERVGTFSASELKQFEIDDAKAKVSSARQKVNSYGARPTLDSAESYKQAVSEQYKSEQDLDILKRQKELYDDIADFGYVSHDDTFTGQWRANYRSNELSREADKAMSEYIANPTEENKQIAYAYDAFEKAYKANNEKALDDENVKASWLTKSMAGYLPQLKDQILPEVIGGGAGLILGSAVGAPNVGMSIGSGLGTFSQMYDVTRGSVYRTLLAEGVDEETALQAANDEALISTLIESGETALSWLMAGGGKAIGAISGAAKASVAKGSTNAATKFLANFATNRAAKKAVAEVSRPLWSKGLRLVGGVALQGGTEYLEEFTQGAVSRANQERALSGNADGKTQLIKGASGVIADAVTGKDPEALADLHSQGMEGFKIGVMLGGSNATVNNIVSHYANAKTVKLKNEVADTILEDEESLNALIEEGKASGEGTVSAKIATEIETARENGKEVTREQVKQLIESNEVYIKAEEQTVDPIEQTAREVVEERNRTPITADEVKKTTGFGDSGAVLITKLMNDNGVSFESAKSAVETAYRVGLTGVDNRQVKFFNDTQRLAFEAGKSDKQVQDRAKQAQAQTASVYKTGFTENEQSAKLTPAEREMFSTFANDFKMDVRMTDKIIAYYVNGKAREANASHVNGKMEVSSTSEKPMVAVAMHEGFHRMRQLDPVATDALMNFLYETSDQNVKRLKVGDTGVSNFERIKGEYSNVEGMEALDYIEEIACRRSETIFSNPEAYNEWRAKLEMNPQAKSAWQKLLEVIRKLLEDMWATITNSKMSLEAKRQAQTELELFADAYRGAMKAADTRLQAVEAQKKTETGYDGIIIKGTAYDTDTFGENNNQYLVLDSNQVKSAEPVTYDDNGKVIPLSERFNTKNDDIRYSLKDSEGKTLTKEQAEYFKDSKIRDKEGNLLVMYHGTTRGGFTVFDGGKDYWYFTNDKKYSYAFEGRKKNGQFYPYTKERMEKGEATPQRYKVYLNVKNPYIADIDTVEDALYWDRSLAGLLREKGFDALMVEDMSQVIVLNANQIKNTTNKNPSAVDDIRHSLKNGVDVSPQKTTDYLNAVEGVRKGKKGAAERLAKYVYEGMIRTEAYDALIEKYGVIPSGERPHRDVQVPRKSGKKKNVSQTVRTILEAKATPDEAVPTIEKMVEDGIFSYDVYTDKQALSDAEEYITTYGWDESLDDWFDAVNKGEVSKELTTMGWALYNNAANIAATTTSETERTTAIKTSLKILDAMVRHQRSAAQALQATRILKKLSPETQLYGVQKSVQAFQNELTEKYGDKAPELKIDEELAEQFINAKTPEERAAIEEEIYKDIGRQMPSRFIDKWNAWRYLAMLGNPRTHVRNLFGNAFFAPVVGVKNLTATAIEEAVYRVSGKKTVRGKALVWGNKADRALLKAAWSDYGNVADMISNGGKYNDSAMANKNIQDGRRIFKFKPLEWARKKNSELLEREDILFSKPHYAYALAQYCKANNITAEQIKRGKAIAPARDYAIKEAQKATYRDTNAFSQMVSEWGRSNKSEKNVVKKAFNTVIEGILPFRKTPANILVRGVEYSPLGMLKGLSYDLYQVGKGKMTASEAIDNISAGLTGTGLLALGVYLAAQGLIRGHGEDEEEKEFKELMGHQSYSLELPNGQSITLDWLAPEALPFFVGVNIWETSKGSEEEINLSAILQSVSHISEPMLEMSCLQGLNDLFEGIGYASSNDTSGLVSVVSSAVTSYLTQGIPTLSGQAERTGEEERMSTYTEKNDFLTGDMQYTLGKASAKIPFWDYNQIPYIDAWGRREASGTALKRGLNNFLNPAYTSTIETSDMEEELLQLYELTGDGGVFPSRADKYFTVDGERKDLTAEEYVRYATLKGEKSYELVSDLVESRAYQKLSATEQVKAIKEAYDYANQKAKQTISNYKPETWVYKADEFGSNVGNYISFKTEVSGKKEANGGKISKQEVVDIVLNMAQNDSETWKMYLSMYDSSNDLYAYNEGVNGEDYMYFLESLAEVDTPTKSGKYGTYTQDEAKEAVKQLEGLSRQEKAILWQSVNTGWKAKNNPWR